MMLYPITKVVIFTKDGAVVYHPTAEQKSNGDADRRESERSAGVCSAEFARCR